jgi:hypothetical protein
MPKMPFIGSNACGFPNCVRTCRAITDGVTPPALTHGWGAFWPADGFGMFVFSIAGTLVVLGPLAGMIAAAVSGAGLGALVNGLMALGIPKDRALKYQSRLQAGEFLVAVTGTPEEVTRAKEILQNSGEIELETHGSA